MKPYPDEHAYICIDLKSYYASVECVHRGLDPMRAFLLVADESRSDQTICLAVSPALKSIGVPSRPRLFEAKQAIRRYEAESGRHIDYIIAPPRMAEYERISAKIYGIYLKYAAAGDIHVYSIDECFIDASGYLHFYREKAARAGLQPARLMAITMIRDVLEHTGITATAGVGTNLYLAKVAMDIVAKKQKPDADGVRIAELNEDSYKYLLWDHRPLTDFWHIGRGRARKLQRASMFTMGDVAARSQWDEEWFYKAFGVDGEILIDHAWGIEPVTMRDIKNYRSESSSRSCGQVLPRPYAFGEARLVMSEMIDSLCTQLFAENLLAPVFAWWAGYDYKSLEAVPSYSGPVSLDFYGRLHPRHANGTVRLANGSSSAAAILPAVLKQFDSKADRRLLFRRLSVSACDVSADDGIYQMDLFTDHEALEKERRILRAMGRARGKYGPNAVFKAANMLEGSTALERNEQIGGHRK